MNNLKVELLTLQKSIWDNGFFNHPGIVIGGRSVLTILRADYEARLKEIELCPEQKGRKNHVWETHSTDSGSETFCSECFILRAVVNAKRELLLELIAEIV